jgi:acyl carrier protein
MHNYTEHIKTFIIDNFLFGDGGQLTVDTHLFDQGILDSTGVLELIAFIEENFNITVADDELIQSNFLSINAIDKFILSKNNYKSPPNVRN